MSKKNKKAEVEVKVEEDIVMDKTPQLYTRYICNLEKDYMGCSAKTSVDATLLPLIVDRKNNIWENTWYVYNGDTLLGFLPIGSDTITIVSKKKKEKK